MFNILTLTLGMGARRRSAIGLKDGRDGDRQAETPTVHHRDHVPHIVRVYRVSS